MSEQLEVLQRIEKHLAVLVRIALADAIKTHLSDKRHRLLYDLTGSVPRTQLEKRTKFSAGKISALWQEWEEAGLLIKDGKQYSKVL